MTSTPKRAVTDSIELSPNHEDHSRTLVLYKDVPQEDR